MNPEHFSCPECGVKLRRAPHLRPGVRVKCPSCQTQFPVPDEPESAPPPPPPPARRPAADEDPAGGRAGGIATRPDDDPLPGRRDEFDRPPRRGRDEYDEDHEGRPLFDEDAPFRRDEDGGPVHYQVDLGRWMGYAKQHWNQILGPAIGFFFLYLVIVLPLGWILGAGMAFVMLSANLPPVALAAGQQLLSAGINILVSGPLYAGMTAVCLAQVSGRRWGFGDFFAGFRKFPAVAGISALNVLLLLPIYFGQVLIQLFQGMGGGPMGMMSPLESLLYLAGNVGWLAVYVFLYARLMFFALPLVFDRDLGPIEAVKESWRMSEGHTLGLVGVAIVLFLITVAGALACGIGLLFTLPLTGLTYAAAYLVAAGKRPVSMEYRGDYYNDPPRRRDEDHDRYARRDNYDEGPRRRDDQDRPRRRDEDRDEDRPRRDRRDREDDY